MSWKRQRMPPNMSVNIKELDRKVRIKQGYIMELLVIIIILSLIFDYINGFHDAANSIATIVSTKVLTPFQAVIWAAFFNFVAFFIAKYIIGGFGIANTVSKP